MRPRVVVVGLGDAGTLVALRLTAVAQVVGISTRPALVSGQELGARLTRQARWRRTYLVPHRRFRHLDAVAVVHGRVVAVDLDRRWLTVEAADGERTVEPYDVLVVASGASNGFWRHDRLEDLGAIDASLAAVEDRLDAATTIAVVGAGPTGVSVAHDLARHRGKDVHLFLGGDEPLAGYHPRVRRWAADQLADAGVEVHPGHRAALPDGFVGDRLTDEPLGFTTGQAPFAADVVLWAVGRVRPHSGFLPAEVLDDDGFVLVDEHLQVPGHPEVFAVGDVAASDPNRSSARNWGWRVVVANVRRQLTGRGRRRRFRAPEHRWGSVLGVQPDGMVVVQPDGRQVRIPRWVADRLLLRGFVERYLYRGLRR